jgi:uncharacterized protein (DUF1015 family)
MARVFPFSGIRYDPAVVDLSSVLSPPYDVIRAELREDLYSRAMQNIVRVELGKEYEADLEGQSDRYTRARDHLRSWLAQGVLVKDERPSLYLHRHSFEPPGSGGPSERVGCFAAVEPVPHERREVLRHELTMSGPREDRIRLLHATQVQTSPVFMLYEDSAAVTTVLKAHLDPATQLGEAVTDGEYGPERHQLWRITDPVAMGTICEGLSRTRLFIADGHHRYETALQLHLPGLLTLLAPLDDPGNIVLPTHRLLPRSPMTADDLLTALVGAGWEVERVKDQEGMLARIAELGPSHHAFGIVDSGTQGIAARRRQAASRPSAAASLDVGVLDREILDAQLGVMAADSEQGRLTYTRDPDELWKLSQVRGALGLFLNPTSVGEMAEAAGAGETMPQKSTYFFPKVPAGLVLMETG